MRCSCARILLLLCLAASLVARKREQKVLSALDQYVEEASARAPSPEVVSSPGSLYSAGAPLGDLARDARARQVDDLVTIVIFDRASAIAKGTTSTSRKSDTKHSVGSIFGSTNPLGPLANLAAANSATQIQGQGETSRENTVSTTLSARVTRVLPNGNMVVEGAKQISVNSEQQVVTVRGVVRPTDVSPANQVRSDRLGQLEVHVTGKGEVGDVIRRPFFLYRLLLGILPL